MKQLLQAHSILFKRVFVLYVFPYKIPWINRIPMIQQIILKLEIVLSSNFGSQLLPIEQEIFEVDKFHLLSSPDKNRRPQRK